MNSNVTTVNQKHNLPKKQIYLSVPWNQHAYNQQSLERETRRAYNSRGPLQKGCQRIELDESKG